MTFTVGNDYEFRFAVREEIESEYSDWAYSYIGEYTQFTVSSDTTAERLAEYQALMQEKKRQDERQEELNTQRETINAIQEQTEQDSEFYNTILSNDYDENKIDGSLSSVGSATDSVDDTEYTGLFSAVFSKFSNIINGNYNNVEIISYPIMNTNKNIEIRSDILSSHIENTFIYTFLQCFWYFLFGMYIFKFSNNLIRKIKSGNILNGYENNDEVITSTML